ncbi:NADH-quinone oxidoreductase subunit L [Anaerobacillus alkalidiazotrophicus]|uniref:NADH-quinone oxidoreductase subunit L n=1 Tax=Anaerobacillus alkalidiazotrophicus TaxID=472963 RepID=A0A1S2MB37_9BACI|nr:NADH-quinone oxidoreductase subunit L [Anaerobacillus alkalidiazotrophicus]OIJ21776.1 NADH-quinone oxidoreductase subunit L [Anaerobacillus alkalidiazotrophicus]
MIQYAWIIPVFPLLAFVVLLLFGRLLKEKAAYVGIIAMAASFGASLIVLFERIGGEGYQYVVRWITFGEHTITMGYEVTALNAMMLIVVTTVSLLVHLFSKAYMHGDDRFPVFYSYLGLFSFSMLGLVLSPNILQLFIFWELVGLCSFLLVGFWFFKPEAAAAAKKAFLTTRIGDVGLFIGLILTFIYTGSFEYATIFAAIENGLVEQTMVTIIAICIFLGAVGKSAQFPLHVWLPDAMEGPTPVSALIHAATMVAAGVYLVGVMYPVFLASETALTVVAYTGAITAIFAASIALVNTDIKRVLAYSTVSQLGFMILALGTMGYVAGLFHLMTHAFFKALLFLGAGSVIYGMHHRQDIKDMGGLWSKMKITAITFLIGTLAIAGVPPFAGFWSKEVILAAVLYNGDPFLFAIVSITAAMTAFYMFRLFFKVFTGKYRGSDNLEAGEHHHEPHESPSVMTIPLVALAVLAIFAGFVNTPIFGFGLEAFLTEGVNVGYQAHGEVWLILYSIVIAAAGIFLAYLIYYKGTISESYFPNLVPGVHKLLLNKYYMDELYAVVFVRPVVILGKVLWGIDRFIIDGIVNMLGYLTKGAGYVISRRHTGQLQTYGLVTVVGGMAVMILAFVLRGYFG